MELVNYIREDNRVL